MCSYLNFILHQCKSVLNKSGDGLRVPRPQFNNYLFSYDPYQGREGYAAGPPRGRYDDPYAGRGAYGGAPPPPENVYGYDTK